MARLILHEEHGPMEIQCGGESKWLCRCGLSKDQPWCDGMRGDTIIDGAVFRLFDGK